MLRDLALVAIGGALGAMARFAVSTAMPRIAFPWATTLVNLLGSFLLGALFLPSGMDHPWRLLVAVGFMGAFTTLSTFSVETVELVREERLGMAAGNIAANGVLGPLLALAGWKLRAM